MEDLKERKSEINPTLGTQPMIKKHISKEKEINPNPLREEMSYPDQSSSSSPENTEEEE